MLCYGGIDFPKLCANRVNFQVDSVGQIGLMYGHGGIDFPKLCAIRVTFQEESVGPLMSDVWSWGNILS